MWVLKKVEQVETDTAVVTGGWGQEKMEKCMSQDTKLQVHGMSKSKIPGALVSAPGILDLIILYSTQDIC
jgi:hypothetical protein